MQVRINEKNKTTILMKDTENNIKRSKETITRYLAMPKTEFIIEKIKTLKKLIDEKEKYVIELRSRLNKIESGELDSELFSIYDENKKNVEKKSIEKNKKKQLIIDDKNRDKEFLQKYYDEENKSKRHEKYSEKEMNRTYEYYLKISDSVPSYIVKNLEKMPNNRGYIWKGIHCYGELKEDHPRDVILFEKLRDNVTKIHEWNETEYLIYTKDRHKKDILYRKLRTKIN